MTHSDCNRGSHATAVEQLSLHLCYLNLLELGSCSKLNHEGGDENKIDLELKLKCSRFLQNKLPQSESEYVAEMKPINSMMASRPWQSFETSTQSLMGCIGCLILQAVETVQTRVKFNTSSGLCFWRDIAGKI